MKRLATLTTLFAIAIASSAHATIVTSVIPSIGPNGIAGTPGYTTGVGGNPSYVDNAISTLMGMGNSGTSNTTDPGAFEMLSGTVTPDQAIVTTFPSWLATAPPTGDFVGEFGNRIFFGTSIEATGDMTLAGGGSGIRLADLTLQKCWYDVATGDPSTLITDPITNFSFAGGNYSDVRVGVQFGADGVLGGGDDTVITSGPANQVVDAIYYIGATDALTFGFGSDFSYNPTISEQANLDNLVDFYSKDHFPQQGLKTCYSLGGVEVGCGDVVFVPEPAANLLILVGLVFFATKMRRR